MKEYLLNSKLRGLAPYEPICGEYSIRLDANESFIEQDNDTLKKILKEIEEASLNRYPDPYATKVCSLFADYCGVPIENVVAGNGSDEIISIIIASFFNKGDSIAVFKPDFSMYGFYAYLSELETVVINKDEDMAVDIDKAVNIINKQNIKGVFMSNPCSPTSIGIPAKSAIRLAAETNALVIIDEAYMDFYNQSVISKIGQFKNLIVLKTCSKAMGLAGIRLGFALSCTVIADALKAAKSPYNVNLLTQCVASVVLSDKEKINKNVKTIIEARDFLYKGIKDLEGGAVEKVFKSDTNFVFFKAKDSRHIYDVMEENKIAVRLMGDYIRITAGNTQENSQCLKVLKGIG